MIYGRNPQKKVTKHQQLINDAAATIALETPALLSSRSKLFDLARKKLIVMDMYTKTARFAPRSYHLI